jgi:hypothetical protein
VSGSTRDSFDIYRAVVVGSSFNSVFIALPSVSGPQIQIRVPYAYNPPKVGSQVWVGATHLFDKFYIIEEPLSVISSLIDLLEQNNVESVTLDDLRLALNQLRGDV